MGRNIDLKKLAALIHPYDSLRTKLFDDGSGAVCLSCGVIGKQLLKLKHKKNCCFMKFNKARNYLFKLLDESYKI